MALTSTKKALSYLLVVVCAIFLLVAVISMSQNTITPSSSTTPSMIDTSTSSDPSSVSTVDRPRSVSFGTTCIDVDLAVTDSEKRQGLSGRPDLEEGRGMLFIYEREGRRYFWMKEMNFSIDIIWLNKERQVIDVHHDLAPETYPKRFSPQEQAQYVLEVPAGTARQKSIKELDTAIFNEYQCSEMNKTQE